MPKPRTSRPSSPPSSTRRSPPTPVEPPIHLQHITYQLKWIQCGKRSCSKWHGPYWYAFWRDHSAGFAGRTRSKYIGRSLPDEIRIAARTR